MQVRNNFHDPDGALIVAENVSKIYRAGPVEAAALSDVNLSIRRGECVAVVGKSGSGKTTLINLLSGIDCASAGSIHVADVAIHALSQEELAVWRGRTIGFVFQFFQLLPTLSVLENVLLPMDFCGLVPRNARRPRALELLSRLAIVEHARKLPCELSGGQQQRAAIARALANDPPIIVADEPTGNLDSATSDQVMELLASMAQSKTVITVTHERAIEKFFSRTITLRDGRVEIDSGTRDGRHDGQPDDRN